MCHSVMCIINPVCPLNGVVVGLTQCRRIIDLVSSYNWPGVVAGLI